MFFTSGLSLSVAKVVPPLSKTTAVTGVRVSQIASNSSETPPPYAKGSSDSLDRHLPRLVLLEEMAHDIESLQRGELLHQQVSMARSLSAYRRGLKRTLRFRGRITLHPRRDTLFPEMTFHLVLIAPEAAIKCGSNYTRAFFSYGTPIMSSHPSPDTTLWYTSPAHVWQSALPIGWATLGNGVWWGQTGANSAQRGYTVCGWP